jgi:6-phosphogluconolactonase (cycloisomerase 2 family)
MAKHFDLRSPLSLVCSAHIPKYTKMFRSTWLFALLLLCSIPAHAQFQQPFVFSTAGAVLTRNDQTGVLTPAQGSPYAAAQFQTLDVQGRFLFGVGTNSVHMYQVNSTTGALSEVPTSPFASPNTNQPLFIAVESTGQYIAVVNKVGQNPGESSIETFQINAANLSLVPVQGSFLELDSTVIGAGADLQNRHFYAFLGPNLSSANQQLQTNSELNDYVLDSQTGLVSLFKGAQPGNVGRCFTLDSQGRFLAIGQGQIEGQVGIYPIAADSGALGTGTITALATSVFPIDLFTEVTGNFLYLTDADTPSPPVHIFSMDTHTLALAETSSSPLPGFTSIPALMGDPTGPFMYGLVGTSIQAYMTDPATGYFTPVTGTSISAPGVNGNFVFSILPGQQNISGPVATWTPTILSLGSITIGSTSLAQMTILTSTGGQAISLSSIAITGANAGEFNETDTCGAPTVLAPSKSCTISVLFTPSAAGLRQATLTATDNAPGSPQSVQLSGVGLIPPPPKPAVTLMPASVSFPTITQGTSSAPATITVTNSGNAALHIVSAVIGGNNSNDFSSTNNCVGTLAAGTSCTISITFAPLAPGERTETITLTDDASDSPQLINVSGNANPAFSAGPAPGASSMATVAPGQTAQFAMQIMPGSGFTGSISLTCSGAPLGANCQLPASVSVSNGVITSFAVLVTTSGTGAMSLLRTPARFLPVSRMPTLLFLLPGSVLLVFFHPKRNLRWLAARCAAAGIIAAVLFFAVFCSAGCGTGTASTLPAAIVTPQGTSVIMVMPSALSASGKPLQLQPIQLTLTVN